MVTFSCPNRAAHERRLVDEVCQVRAHEPRGPSRDGVQVNIRAERDVFRMHL